MSETKKEFESELQKRLAKMSRDERQKALDYFNELYYDMLEKGGNEQEIIRSFGSMDEIAARLMPEPAQVSNEILTINKTLPAETGESKKRKTSVFAKIFVSPVVWFKNLFKNKTFMTVYFSLFFITIPVTIALFCIPFSILIAIFATVVSVIAALISLIVSFAACAAAIIIAGPLYIGYGIYILVANINTNAGLALMGSGFALVSLGIGFIILFKLFNYINTLVFNRAEKREKALERFNKRLKLRRKMGFAVTAFLTGAVLFAVGFGNSDWNIHKLDYAAYISANWTLDDSTDAIDSVNLKLKTRDYKIVRVDENFRVEANNFDQSIVTVEFDNGTLTITESFKFDLNRVFNIYSSTNLNLQKVIIYIPQTAAVNP